MRAEIARLFRREGTSWHLRAVTLCGGLSALALVVLGAQSSAPTPTPVSVELDAPSGCSDSRAFFERLRARTDRVRPAKPGEDALRIEVKLVRNGAKVQGELRIKQDPSETATRKVDGASCEEVIAALSLTAALALERLVPEVRADNPSDGANGANGANAGSDAGAAANNPNAAGGSGGSSSNNDAKPNAGATASGGETARGGSPNKDNPHPDDAAKPPDIGANSLQAQERLQLEVGARLGLAELLSPLVATGAGALLRGRLYGASADVSVAYWSNGLTNSSEDADYRAVLFALSACPVSLPLGSRVALEPCAVATGGFLHVAQPSALEPREADRSYWALGALARLRTPITPLVGLELDAGLVFPLVQRSFITTRPVRSVAETPRISPFLGLAAVVSP